MLKEIDNCLIKLLGSSIIEYTDFYESKHQNIFPRS